MSDVGGEQVQAEPVQVCEGRWRTRGGDIRNVTPTPECDNRHDRFPWRDTAYDQTWASNGRYFVDCEESPLDLEEYLGPIEQQPEPQPEPVPEPDAELRIRLLQQANDSQAETIGRLLSEARDLNMEIGGLERQLVQRDARIRDLETMHAAASQAVVDAGKVNDKLRAQADASVSRLQADRNDLAGKVITLREQLQQANDRLAFLETLQPIAAACHTAQTMVRDMLGHMRCLLALQHTTDRRDSCMLLESILEVFDEAECNEDEDDDTTSTTSTTIEAKQG